MKLPEQIPRPSQDYSLSIRNSAIRTEMDSGRVRQRRRFMQSSNQVRVVWSLTDEEFQLFESFLFHALHGATAWFECDILTGGGIKTHKVRFAGANYDASYKAHMTWKVSATLDIFEVNRLSAEEIAYSIYPIDDMQSLLYKIVNIQMPEKVGTINE